MKPHPVPTFLRVVYLLHFDKSRGAEAHYVGITTPSRLAERMREHCSGRAAARTARAVLEGEPWRLANIWTTGFRELEAHVAALPDFYDWCPVCRGGPGLKHFNTKKKAPRKPLEPSDLLDLTPRGLTTSPAPKSHEKGEAPKLPPPSLSFGQP